MVIRALDYQPKVTVVYFLRVRRGTSQHSRVTPTPEEEYVATTVNEYLTLMCFFPQGNNDWLIHNCMVSLHNTVKVHN